MTSVRELRCHDPSKTANIQASDATAMPIWMLSADPDSLTTWLVLIGSPVASALRRKNSSRTPFGDLGVRWPDTALNPFGMTTSMNQTTRFIGQHSSPRFVDFEDRYSNRMECCVEPQHSRADGGLTPSGSTAARGSRRQKSARSQFSDLGVRWLDTALNPFGMTTSMNQTTRFVGQHSSPHFLNFEDRYSNRMKGCVEPQHSRADGG